VEQGKILGSIELVGEYLKQRGIDWLTSVTTLRRACWRNCQASDAL
jgi:hypothetical protein